MEVRAGVMSGVNSKETVVKTSSPSVHRLSRVSLLNIILGDLYLHVFS